MLVIIDVPSDETITYRQGVTSVAGLSSAENLVIEGGSLTVTEESVIDGDLSVENSAVLIANGPDASLTANGLTTVIDGIDTSLFALNGGTLTLNGLETLTGDVDIQAVGEGSLVNLPNLTTFEGTNVFTPSSIIAQDGGLVQAENLETITQVNLSANNSTLELPGVNSLTGTNSGADTRFDNTIDALNGGSLTLGTISFDGDVDIQAVGEGSLVSLPNLTTFEGSEVFSPSSIVAQNGGIIQVDNLSSITEVDVTSDNSPLTLLALEISSGNNLAQALNGGLLDLSNLTTIPDGLLTILADGTNSIVNISSLSVGEDFLQTQEVDGGTIIGI